MHVQNSSHLNYFTIIYALEVICIHESGNAAEWCVATHLSPVPCSLRSRLYCETGSPDTVGAGKGSVPVHPSLLRVVGFLRAPC